MSIVRFYTSLPKSVEAAVMGRQLLRSGTSLGARYYEACRARSHAEFISKLEGALQELDESAYWLVLLEEAGIMTGEATAPLLHEAEQLTAILVRSVKTVKSRK